MPPTAPSSIVGDDPSSASATRGTGTEPKPRALGYQPALDGLRAVAVLAVLGFHAGFGWLSGGYLGVSIFFTLSGFLITRLLLTERSETGGVDLGRFYARRARRLLPASCLCLIGIVVVVGLGGFDGVIDLRRDLLGAATQLANWAQLTSGGSYADLFDTGASPVKHYWSLAIEEQFYLVWPVIFGAALAGRSRKVMYVVAGGLFLLTAAWAPLIARVWGDDAAYLSTPARMGELLAGVALAVVTHHRVVAGWFRWLAIGGLVAIAGLMVVTPTVGGWVYAGGLPLFGCLSAVVIAGLLVDGPARRALAVAPLVGIGRISYGIYLFHWPIFLLADQHLDSLGGVGLVVVKVGLSIGAAVLSYVVVEQPIRRVRWRPRVTGAAAVGLVAVVVLAVVVVAPGRGPGFGEVAGATEAAVAIPPGDPGPLRNERGGQARPVRILVTGDSTALVMGAGLVEWAADRPGTALVDVDALGGCGLVTGGRFDDFLDDIRDECDQLMHRDLPDYYGTHAPDVVVVSIAAADTWNRTWEGTDELRPADPSYTARIEADYDDFFDAAVDADVPHVVWLRPARIGTEPKYYDPSYVDGSQELVEDVVRSQAAEHPDRVEVLDFRSWFETTPYPSDLEVRPDGVHLIPEVAEEVAVEWLGPQLLDLALSSA